MRFFNIDFHISVIADVKLQLETLGHRVDSLSLSNHTWVFGRQKDQVPSLDGMSLYAFGQAECNRFFAAERRRLADYDGFIVTHTPCLAGLYEQTGKPVICVVSTRYDGFCQTPESRAWLENLLLRMHFCGQLILLANNAYDAWHVERQLGIRPLIIPSICDYTGLKWDGAKTPAFVAGRIDLPGLKRLPRGHSWQDVADAACCVTIPYNVSLMSVFERHAMGLPMLMPSGLWTLLHGESLADLAGGAIPTSEELEAAAALSDWHSESLPGISFFDSLDEIPAMLREGVPMTTGQQERKEAALIQWSEVIDGVATGCRNSYGWKGTAADSLEGKWKCGNGFTFDLQPGGLLVQIQEANRRLHFGTWAQTEEGFTMEIAGAWSKRVDISMPGRGIWHLNAQPDPGGTIHKKVVTMDPVWGRRKKLTCDSYKDFEDAQTIVLHTDSVLEWHRLMRPTHHYRIISCHSDTVVDERFRRIFDDELLDSWYAMNVLVEHPKLHPVPVGVHHRLALDSWMRTSNFPVLSPLVYDILLDEAAEAPKTTMFHVSFSVRTNRAERERCLRSIGLPNRIGSQVEYLADLSSARFCISPEGNGPDCSRVWEALYCRTVPVITRNPMVGMGMYDGLPIVVLEQWEDFCADDFTEGRYELLVKDFDPTMITAERWVPAKIEQCMGA
jgi:hypothetical protein